jgi:prepilin-type N-terminal cleavage/methylation domain-containing protein
LNKAAFSLIELVVVILLVGIVVVVAVDRSMVASSVRGSIAANELVASLRYARNAAMRSEKTMRVSFDVASNLYSVAVYDLGAPGGFSNALNPADRRAWIVDLTERFQGVYLASVDINGGATLYFDGSNGIPLDAAGLTLATNGLIVFNSGAVVSIAPLTGYSSIE